MSRPARSGSLLLIACTCLLAGCTDLPDLGGDPDALPPPPALLPLDQVLATPLPEATPEAAAALAARGAAVRAAAGVTAESVTAGGVTE